MVREMLGTPGLAERLRKLMLTNSGKASLITILDVNARGPFYLLRPESRIRVWKTGFVSEYFDTVQYQSTKCFALVACCSLGDASFQLCHGKPCEERKSMRKSRLLLYVLFLACTDFALTQDKCLNAVCSKKCYSSLYTTDYYILVLLRSLHYHRSGLIILATRKKHFVKVHVSLLQITQRLSSCNATVLAMIKPRDHQHLLIWCRNNRA